MLLTDESVGMPDIFLPVAVEHANINFVSTAAMHTPLPERVIFDVSIARRPLPQFPRKPTFACAAISVAEGQQPTSRRSSRVGVTQISWSPILIDASADRHFDRDMAW